MRSTRITGASHTTAQESKLGRRPSLKHYKPHIFGGIYSGQGSIVDIRLKILLIFYVHIVLEVSVTPFLREHARCGNNQNQRTHITVNVEYPLSPPRVDIDGIAGTLCLEHRTSRPTNLGLEDAFHRNVIIPYNFGGIYIGQGSIPCMGLTNPLVFSPRYYL